MLWIVGALVAVVRCAGPTNEAEIDILLQSLSIEEKVGQMAQLAIDDFVDTATDEVKEAYAVQAIQQKYVGSILNTYGGRAHSRETWAAIQAKLQSYAAQNRHPIPILYGLDSIHGATFVAGSTLFPQEIAVAATFNTTIAETSSKISAYETRAASVPWTFAPVCDLGLDMRWSRLWEDFGEDPYLGGAMAAAYVRGFQGTDREKIGANNVAACLKHYVGYGNPISGKDRTPAVIPELYLREYHLPVFEAGIEAGAVSVMVNSALFNGIPCHMNKWVLTDVLKGELGFDGVVVTDWGDIGNIYTRDHVATSDKEAIGFAINAGIDLAMIPYDITFVDKLLELVKEGTVSEERVNDAVRRVLRMKLRLDLWNRQTTSPGNYPNFNNADAQKASYDAATEVITLLKNADGVLPLKTGTQVLVTGPNADTVRALEGGWSWSWQGNTVPEFSEGLSTVQAAIAKVNGAATTTFIPGVSWDNDGKYWEDKLDRFDEAVEAAGASDVVVFVGGENSYTEKPGDLQDVRLNVRQLDLLKALLGTGKPVVLVLVEGRPRVIDEVVRDVKGLLLAYLPGSYGADAIADVLFGVVNPSGKLPYTYPLYASSLLNYWHKYSEEQEAQPGAYDYASDYNPLAEFGFGLSYTTFEYSNLRVPEIWSPSAAGTVTVSVDVTNTGTRAGKEAVLLFVSDLYASVAPDMYRLRKFTKVELAAGAGTTVSFQLSAKDFSLINAANKRVVERGDFTVSIGYDHKVKADITVTGNLDL